MEMTVYNPQKGRRETLDITINTDLVKIKFIYWLKPPVAGDFGLFWGIIGLT